MFAIPAAELLGVPPVLLVLIAGACMTASAYFGIKALTVISAVSVPPDPNPSDLGEGDEDRRQL